MKYNYQNKTTAEMDNEINYNLKLINNFYLLSNNIIKPRKSWWVNLHLMGFDASCLCMMVPLEVHLVS